MEIYSVINISNLQPFKPLMLDDELEAILPLVDDLVIDWEMMLVEDIILEKITETGQRKWEAFWVGWKGQHPSVAKWFNRKASQVAFSFHLLF